MRRVPGYFLLIAAVLLCLLPSCRRGKVLSASKMTDIYVEMFLADQWLSDNPRLKNKADTLQFYGAIFKRHGCRFEDYDASVNYYLSNPEKYIQILKKATDRLKRMSDEVSALQKKIEAQNKVLEGLSVLTVPEFALGTLPPDSLLMWARVDTAAAPDSATLDSLHRDSLRLDSLRLDSLRLDSLRRDSVKRASRRLDSLRRDSLRRRRLERNKPAGPARAVNPALKKVEE